MSEAVRGDEQIGMRVIDAALIPITSLRAINSEGLVYPRQLGSLGQCVGLLYPDLAAHVIQGRHAGDLWSGTQVDLYRDAGSGQVFRVQ